MFNASDSICRTSKERTDQSVTISFVLLSAYKGPLPSHFGTKTSNTHLLLFVESGKGSICIGEQEYRLFPGRCFLKPPGMTIQTVADEGEVVTVSELEFSGYKVTSVREVENVHVVQEPFCLPVSGELNESELGQAIRNLCERHENQIDRERFSSHCQLLSLVERIWEANERWRGNENLKAVEHTIRLMEQDYFKPLSREMLSKEAGMSPSHYSTVFRKVTGKSPMEYLAEIRIEKAKDKLLTSNARIRDIALGVGYASEFYFSNKFKKMTGISPREFISQNLGKKLLVSHPEAFSMMQTVPSRVIGLFVEDHLKVFGIKPLVQFASGGFQQRYLGSFLREVRHFDPYESDFQAIQQEKPDIILLGIPQFAEEGRFDRLANIAPTYLFENPVDDWRQTLRTVGKLLGKASEAERAIHEYNQKAEVARSILKHSIGDRSVALVRVYADGDIRLYGGPNGYTGSVLYGDLGLRPPKLVHDLIWGSSEWMKKITFDMLSELDAQRLLIVVDEAGRQQAGKMTSTEQWKSVPAVREGNVYEVRSDIWMTYGLHAHCAKIDNVLAALTSEGTYRTKV
ncbi:helix-turn-helix domain-containing protein [Brevibacillus sp. AG]|uniref:helix-turn-helix domain-containing protein n=1 Tax=Brevibacillus sp. AG TaxID=3020891 RepID=UPI000853E305|nr:helix-turn-helix domain-containing protein [Brevibacillus sp. AG]MDC0759459.1 helix-turn-helix domain-containing protein [Brevibacillus sp. AG]